MNGNRKAANIITMLNATTFYSMCYVLHSNAWHVYGFKKKKNPHNTNQTVNILPFPTRFSMCVFICVCYF